MKKTAPLIALILTASLLCNNPVCFAKGVKRTTLKQKKVTMKVGDKKKIQLKSKKKKAKYTYKSSKKKIVRVSKSGVMSALKTGKAKITVKETLKKKSRKIGTVTVTVKAKEKQIRPSQSPSAGTPSVSPQQSDHSTTPTPAQTASPTPKGKVTPTPMPTPEDSRLKNTPEKFYTKRKDVEYGKRVDEKYDSTTTGVTRKTIVILPPGYTEEKKYPVLYLFHGGMGDENDWIQGNVINMMGNMLADGEAKEMILVLPNCRCREDDSIPSSGGLAPEHVQSFDNFINDFRDNLKPYIESKYSVATGRQNTAIAGLSMGGRVSLHIGFTLPELVGYTGAFCPAYGIFPYTNNGLTESGLFTAETFTLPDEYKKNTLVMLNAGLQDNMVKDEPERYSNALKANNVDHIFYKTKGGHDWEVWRHGFYNFARYIFKDKTEGGLV